MKQLSVILALTAALIAAGLPLRAQVPVEVFGGHERATVDVMFFRFFKTKEGKNSRWLFFNRNRASVDYRITTTTYLPQFGFTEALSYNHPALGGVAPVLVASILNRGYYAKAGIQYARTAPDYTLFTWMVSELREKPNFDWFLLARYTPRLAGKLRLFTQLELVNAFPTNEQSTFSFTQRYRLGIKLEQWQLGAGADFQQNGRNTYVNTRNIGAFVRHEF